MLPIIAQAVLAKPGDTLIIEQPELHLHPRAQAELADLFIAMARNGTRFLIETHSEHLIITPETTNSGVFRCDNDSK